MLDAELRVGAMALFVVRVRGPSAGLVKKRLEVSCENPLLHGLSPQINSDKPQNSQRLFFA